MKKRFIIANWKMKPESTEKARELLLRADDVLGELGEHQNISLVMCPPFVFLDEAQGALASSHLLHSAELGAQDVALGDDGALTGEVSASQLVSSGVRYVIVGHSERRYELGETDDTVNAKLRVALEHDLVPIVCVGERTREGEWQDALRAQVRATCAGIEGGRLRRCLFAYEPVWAISTNPDAKPDSPESAQASILLLRERLAEECGVDDAAVLYGGSVNPDNVASYLSREGIDGVLVGGASVRPDDFADILRQSVRIP